MKTTKKSRSYSIIIVSDATTKNKSFSISSPLLRNIIIGLVILLFSFGYIIYDYLTISFDNQEYVSLQKKLAQKEEVIQEINTTIDSLKANLATASEYSKRILVAMGLNSPNALKKVGSGGDSGELSSMLNETGFQDMEVQTPRQSTPSQEHILHQVQSYDQNSRQVVESLKMADSFYEEQKIRLAATPSIWPTNGYITDDFGARKHPITGKRDFHHGLDIATQTGNEVVATADGYVIMAERQFFLGNVVAIDHNFGYVTRYGHMAEYIVKPGDFVKRGDVIGYVGNTGRSSAPHLHYEVRYNTVAQDPTLFILD